MYNIEYIVYAVHTMHTIDGMSEFDSILFIDLFVKKKNEIYVKEWDMPQSEID